MLNPFTYLSPEWGLVIYAAALGLVCAVMCALLLALLLQTGWAWRLAVDRPNARSLHRDIVPRCGGWGMLSTLLLVVGATSPVLWQVLVALSMLVIVSYLDDRGGMPILLRFAVQIAALCLVLVGHTEGLSWWLLAISALAWLWGTNLYNFMDGADGMAGAMTVTGFAGYAAASGVHDLNLSTASIVASGTALGFLVFNRPPAKLFLGDVGSIPLGFLAGALGFIGWREHLWPFWFPFLLFSPFVLDASVTLAARAVRREKVWQAHREHYYQRLIQSGFSHGQSLSVWAAAMLGAMLVAIGLLYVGPAAQLAGIAVWCLILAGLGSWIDGRWQRSAAARQSGGEHS